MCLQSMTSCHSYPTNHNLSLEHWSGAYFGVAPTLVNELSQFPIRMHCIISHAINIHFLQFLKGKNSVALPIL
jgi:pyruvate carboxylase